MRAVIYNRGSREDQTNTLDLQNKKCSLQAQLMDANVIETIQDSKSGKSLNRDGIQEVLEMVQNKSVDVVIIYKLDRLTRNVSDLNQLIELFNKNGVNLVSVMDSLDTSTASGRMVINMLGTISQWERETISERTSAVLQDKKATKKAYTREVFGFDKIDGEMIENESEQLTIKYILKERSLGIPFYKIADSLNAKEVLSKQGKKWHWSSVRNICNRLKIVA